MAASQYQQADAEFQRAVNQTRANLIFARDSLTDQALFLGYYQSVAGDWRLFRPL